MSIYLLFLSFLLHSLDPIIFHNGNHYAMHLRETFRPRLNGLVSVLINSLSYAQTMSRHIYSQNERAFIFNKPDAKSPFNYISYSVVARSHFSVFFIISWWEYGFPDSINCTTKINYAMRSHWYTLIARWIRIRVIIHGALLVMKRSFLVKINKEKLNILQLSYTYKWLLNCISFS